MSSGSNGKAVNFSAGDLAKAAELKSDVPVPVTYLQDVTLRAIKSYGYTDADAKVMLDVRSTRLRQ